jgi:hypothetical protein
MSLDSCQRSREAVFRTASAVWRFGEETLVSDPFSGGAFIAPPFFFVWSESSGFFGPRPREACSPTAFRGRLLRESAPGIPNAGKRVGAAGFPTAPAFRHSEVLLSVARPGSGWAAKVNFSKNNNSISSFVQSHQVKYKMEYADICFVDRNSTRRPSGEKSFPWVKAEPTRILQIVPSFDV